MLATPSEVSAIRKLTRYALRKSTVEPVFGQIKEARGIRRFRLRGVSKVTSEWEMRDEITPKLVRTTVPSSSSTGRSSICAWTDSEKDQNASKEKMACSWADSERFLGPGFCLVSGRCSCLSSARVNSAEPSGRPLNVLSRMAFRLDSGWVVCR
jgi:Transposase DDE domain